MKKNLVEIFKEIGNFSGNDLGGNDKNSTHNYLETYDRLFEPYRNESTFLEIGLATGDSIKLWNDYFENSTIVGCDISIVFNVNAIPFKNGNIIDIIECDATKPKFLEKIKGYKFQIVNDDGEHTEQSQVATFNLLKPYMAKGSLYLIEDILNLDSSRDMFMSLHDNCEIFDLRNTKGRFDDVIICYRF